MKLAVTGCHGYIGGHLVDRLRFSGHEVIGLDHRPRPPWAAIDAECVELGEPRGAALAAGALGGCQAVFHLAARQPFDSDLFRLLRGNVQRTSNLLLAMRLSGVTRLIHASTAAVYGRAEPSPVAEDAPARPENNYQATKRVAELLAEAFSRTPGGCVTVLRMTGVFGGRGRTGPMPALIDAVLLGSRIALPAGGTMRRSHVHVDDAVSALVLALDRPQSAPLAAYNVGGAESPTDRELCEIIADALGRRVAIDPDDDPNTEVAGLVVDIARSRQVLGYAPRPLRDGVAELALAMARERAAGAEPSVPRREIG